MIPWEQPGLDVFTAFFRTVGQLLFSPRAAFERMPITSAFGRPLAFAIIAGWIGVIANTFWDLILSDWVRDAFPWARERGLEDLSAVTRVIVALSAPVWLPIALLIGAGLQHLFLFLVGGAKRGFLATFRVECYAWATMILALLPMCGQFVGFFWGIVLAILGLSAAHRISTGKAALAVLLPLILCCGCAALGAVLFGAAILGALGWHS